MEGIELIESQELSLVWLTGIDHPFFRINTATAVHTWILLGFLLILLLPVRFFLLKHKSLARFILLSGISFFVDLCNQALGHFSFAHFSFITALFLFILSCNIVSIIPWMEEPTKDVNTTLALGFISFFYIQTVAIYKHAILTYIKEYFSPFFFMFPLNIVGKLASIVSISFRLFGNIFGGSMIPKIYFGLIQGSLIGETIGLVLGFNLGLMLFFTLFEGFLQAFVFTMLTLTYLSIAVHGEGDH